jgi:hypothetical protein
MNRQLMIGLGLIGLVGAGVSAQLAIANPVKPAQLVANQPAANQPAANQPAANQPVSEPLCFMQQGANQPQDLTKICGQSSLRPAIAIDPNAPVSFNMPRSRTPSALWATEPDSDEPIELGETYVPEPTAARPTKSPQSAAQKPTGDEGPALDDN